MSKSPRRCDLLKTDNYQHYQNECFKVVCIVTSACMTAVIYIHCQCIVGINTESCLLNNYYQFIKVPPFHL